MSKKYFLSFIIFFTLLFNANAQFGFASSSTPIITQRDGDSTLGLTYNQSMCGLKYIQSSIYVTDRYTTNPGQGLPAVFTINSLPNCYTIQQVYMYWITSSSTIDPSFTINGLPSTGTLIGSGPDKCWSMGTTRHYRADVTSEVAGNGTYTIDVGAGVNATDGITLLIIYTDPTETSKGTLIIHDGCIVNVTGTEENHTINNINACGNSISSSAFLLMGDLQDNVFPPEHAISIGNVTDTFSNDFYNFDTLSPIITAGMDTLRFTYENSNNGDCYSIIAAGLYFQTNDCGSCNIGSGPISLSVNQTADTCQLCNGTAEVFASGGTGNYDYFWSPSPQLGQGTPNAGGLCFGDYTVTVADGSCNVASVNFSMDSIGTAPNISITNENPHCETENNFTLSASPSGGTWSGSGIIDSQIGIFDPSISGPGNFIVSYTFGNSLCSTTENIQIEIDSFPEISISGTNEFCESDLSVNFNATPMGGQWNGNGISNATLGTFDPAIAGIGNHLITYSVTNVSCTNIDSILITVAADPLATFSYVQLLNSFSFTNSSTNSNSFIWNFGNGDTTSQVNPSYTYTTNGTYIVCLTAMGDFSCTHVACDTIQITGLSISEIGQGVVSIFPNPSNDMIYISSKENIKTIYLRDLTGKTILSRINSMTPEMSLNLNQISSGIYFLLIETENGRLTKKVEIVR